MITLPLKFFCIITNNPPCIVYDHLIGLTITGKFSKWCHQPKYRARQVQGKENISHWLYTVVYWRSLPEAGRFTTVLRSSPPWSSDPCYRSSTLCSLLICNGDSVFSILVWIEIGNWTLCNSLTDSKSCDKNYKRSLIWNLWEK